MAKKRIHKSDSSHAVLDPASRKRKAEKIRRVLAEKTDLKRATVLDIGTGAGYIAHHLADHVGHMTSIDVVDERQVTDGYSFVQVNDETMPFADGTFDVVISNHVIEHVPGQHQHVAEVLRVLKPGGIAYFATPNRNWLIDPHYRLPFINWLPRPAASAYLKAAKSKAWDIYPVRVGQIRRYAGRSHRTEPVVVDIIKNPAQYHLDTLRPLHPVTKRLPRAVLRPLSHLSPTILITITKA